MVATEIAQQIDHQLPEYAEPTRPFAVQRLRLIERAIGGFIDQLEHPVFPTPEDIRWLQRFGGTEAREGHRLETVQNAFLIGAWVGWRRIAQECRRLCVSSALLCELGDAAYRYADDLFAATAQGYHAAGDIGHADQQFRKTLIDQILAESPTDPRAFSPDWPRRHTGRSPNRPRSSFSMADKAGRAGRIPVVRSWPTLTVSRPG
ncbi:hypothetical protein [Fodinicola feengrottensis]|uniref:hypothetical protein n=1 Tax=Fodinicola feengrottensis TaxID=435914 RepID=UPI0013D3CCFB|nr:hypothetical protein [Fodinicola feengrottensis]